MEEVDDEERWRSPYRPGKRWRNNVGDFWRCGRRYLIEEFDWGLAVSEWSLDGQEHIWSSHFRFVRFDYGHPSGVDVMASQWISKAITTQKQGKQSLPATDKAIFADRPALTEFMTLLVDDEGLARAPSVLMIIPTATGLKIGLKDDMADGWLWREAETLQKGLNAIEAALQSGDVRWSPSGGKNGKKR
jgi:hypothetical protein